MMKERKNSQALGFNKIYLQVFGPLMAFETAALVEDAWLLRQRGAPRLLLRWKAPLSSRAFLVQPFLTWKGTNTTRDPLRKAHEAAVCTITNTFSTAMLPPRTGHEECTGIMRK